jgi:hypothetical protein
VKKVTCIQSAGGKTVTTEAVTEYASHGNQLDTTASKKAEKTAYNLSMFMYSSK